jgi:hypothetical protein
MVDNAKYLPEQDGTIISKHRAKEKKTIITLSLNQDVLDELKEESVKEQISLSAKVSKILSKHIVTYRFSQDTKSVFVTQKTFNLIIEQVDEDLLLDDFTNNALDFVPTVFYAKNIPFTIDNIIKYALIGAGLEGGIFNHFHYYNDSEGFTNLVMRHNFGLKWSRILSKGHARLIEKMLGCHTLSTIFSSSVIIKVPIKKKNVR